MAVMDWSFRETAAAAVLYIIFCEVLPYCFLATLYMVWFAICVCTAGIIYIPPYFYGTSNRGIVDCILEARSNVPIWLGQKMGLSRLMISPLDRNYAGRYRNYRVERENLRYAPAKLPRVRKRRLSDGRKASQLSSLFFKKLPLEIRQMIYKEVIIDGSEHRHIIEKWSTTSNGKRGRDQLWGAPCMRQPDSIECWTEDVLVTGISMLLDCCFEPKTGCYGTLELAKTCRQVYLEVINLFYSSSESEWGI